ncbi:signal recognition particle [Anderseniella sp. Alg231-50]|uniref:signal recognition particle n=1 Tax=Anderseniella sp. Alg231-50 TaxID=1922226 RepID=UPI00307B677E
MKIKQCLVSNALVLSLHWMIVPASADSSLQSLTIATELGTVLASEEFCGLTYKQDAIVAFVEEKVKADDMGFAGNLEMQVMGSKALFNEMGQSQKTAHCTQIKRVAKSYGFAD